MANKIETLDCLFLRYLIEYSRRFFYKSVLDDFNPENTYVESINVVYASVMNLLLFLDICLYSMLQCPFFSITRLRRRLRLDFQGNLENDD